MTTILVIDDQQNKRKSVIDALIHRYQVAGINQPKLTDAMIVNFRPSIILINRLALNFNSINLFLIIKNQYPKIPVLLYALQCPDAIKILKQTISMALGKKRTPERRNNLAPAMFIDPIFTPVPEKNKSLQEELENKKKLAYVG